MNVHSDGGDGHGGGGGVRREEVWGGGGDANGKSVAGKRASIAQHGCKVGVVGCHRQAASAAHPPRKGHRRCRGQQVRRLGAAPPADNHVELNGMNEMGKEAELVGIVRT